MSAGEKTKHPISDEALKRALQTMFGAEVTHPDAIPKLNLIDKTKPKQRSVIGQKPLSERIEYNLLMDTPRDKDGALALEDVMAHYYKVVSQFRGKTQAELSGARLIAVLAFCAEVDESARVEVKHFIANLEYEINAGGNPCDGRHSVLSNSGAPEIDVVNRWVNNYKISARDSIKPANMDAKITSRSGDLSRT